MAQQTIETTDTLNAGRVKINANFTELYGSIVAPPTTEQIQDIVAAMLPGATYDDGAGIITLPEGSGLTTEQIQDLVAAMLPGATYDDNTGIITIPSSAALITLNNQTASYTPVLADAGKLVEINNGSANTFTVPPNSSVAFPVGTQINVVQQGAGQTSFVAGSGVTIRSANAALKLAWQYSSATLIKRDTNEWYLIGDLAV